MEVISDILLFNNLCRLCCSRKDLFYPIFEDNVDNLGTILKYVLPNLNITENDSKPQQICSDCYDKVKMLNEFIKQCFESECRYDKCLIEADNAAEFEHVIVVDSDNMNENTSETAKENFKIYNENKYVHSNFKNSRTVKPQKVDEKIANSILSTDDIIHTEIIDPISKNDLIKCSLGIKKVQTVDKLTTEYILTENDDLRSSISKPSEYLDDPPEYIEESNVTEVVIDDAVHVEECIEASSDCQEINNVDYQDDSYVSSEIVLSDDSVIEEMNVIDDLNCDISNKINETESITPCQLRTDEDRTTEKAPSSKENIMPSRMKAPCTICGKVLKRKSSLKSHMGLHTGIRNHKCTFCDKSFMNKTDLNKHMHVHNRTYVCRSCGSCFISKYRLLSHQKMHLGEKLFQCDICGKLLSNKQYLSLHMKGHTESLKSYHCFSCPTVFKDSWSLREHFDKLHCERPSEKYACPSCDKVFKWRANYNRHVKKHRASC